MRAAVFVAVCLVCWSFAWSSASLQWLVLVLHDTYYVCVASRLWGSKVSRLTDYFLNSVSLYDSWRLERNNRTHNGLIVCEHYIRIHLILIPSLFLCLCLCVCVCVCLCVCEGWVLSVSVCVCL